MVDLGLDDNDHSVTRHGYHMAYTGLGERACCEVLYEDTISLNERLDSLI
jgi:hypothetical protein